MYDGQEVLQVTDNSVRDSSPIIDEGIIVWLRTKTMNSGKKEKTIFQAIPVDQTRSDFVRLQTSNNFSKVYFYKKNQVTTRDAIIFNNSELQSIFYSTPKPFLIGNISGLTATNQNALYVIHQHEVHSLVTTCVQALCVGAGSLHEITNAEIDLGLIFV